MSGSTRRVEILSKNQVFNKAIFRIDEVHLKHETYDQGMTEEIVRLNLDRGDSVAAVVHDPQQDTLIFTEQFRYPTYDKGPGWILELPAGMLRKDESPEETMSRELEEEIGYRVGKLTHISTFYVSPGGTSERIFLYYAPVSPINRVSAGGGVISEGEDIRVVEVKTADAMKLFASGEIADAKTIIGLQWLRTQRQTWDRY